MRDRLWIMAGLLLFVAAVTAPFWYRRTPVRDLEQAPNLVLPANQKQCVAPVSTMRASHMVLLTTWRQEVVRNGDRRYIAFDGKVYQKSLTGTCLGCHSKEQFCDRCHAYAGVSGPYCWNCHNASPSRTVAVLREGMEPNADAAWLAPGFSAGLRSPVGHGQPLPLPGSRP
jgi:hypothetical protein